MNKIYVLGDSHSMYFSYGIKKGLFYPFDVKVCTVSAATAAGLRNENSFTQASVSFKSFLKDVDRNSLILFQLGEVDCGILIWLRSEKYGTSINQELDKSISAYVDFIQELRMEGFVNIGITSPTLPTINDEDHAGVVISERRKKVVANQRERTDLTLLFNRELKKKVEDLGIVYIDTNVAFIDMSTGLCNAKFRNKNVRDHHMDNELASVVWAAHVREVAKCIFNKQPSHKFKGVSIKDTYLKKLPTNSKELRAESKCFVPKGSLISFHSYYSNSPSFIESVHIDGSPMDKDFNFIFPSHWSLTPFI